MFIADTALFGIGRLFDDVHTTMPSGAHDPHMPPSIETQLQQEIAALGEWLVAQGLDLHSDRAHADEGSRDRLYWRYGYYVGLKKALAALASSGATVH